MMKILKITSILNLLLISNVGYTLEIPYVDIRSDLLVTPLTTPVSQPTSVTNIPNFVLQSGGDINPFDVFNSQNRSTRWSITNRIHNNSGPIIVGGSISISSPLILTTTGSTISIPRLAISTSVVPEAETYMMLLAGLGLIGLLAAKRSLR